MKKLSLLLFCMTVPANGLSAMFSSENNGCLPEEGFRFKNRTVRYNKDLVIPKECREQELYDWVALTEELKDSDLRLTLARESVDFKKKISLVRYGKDRNVIFAKEKIKKNILDDPSLLDDEGNLIIAKWFGLKGLKFNEPPFKETTIIEKSFSPSYGAVICWPEETIRHNYDDEYTRYKSNEEKEGNKQRIHSYIHTIYLQQGIWTYLRSLRIIEWLFGKSAQKINDITKFRSTYEYSLDQQRTQEISELKILLECTKSMLQKVENKLGETTHLHPIILWEGASNLVKKQFELFEKNLPTDELMARKECSSFKERLKDQKELLEKEIKSLENKANHLPFARSVMKRSEFNMYQKFRLAIGRE